MTEFEDEYSAALGSELRELKGALLSDTIHTLEPAEPLCIPETATVHDTVVQMVARRQPGVLIVNQEGRLVGIFTERDVLTRVVGPGVAGPGLDVHHTPISQVMTRDPEALALLDDSSLPVAEKSLRFRKLLRNWKFPELVEKERRFRDRFHDPAEIRHVRVRPTPGFEDERCGVEIVAQSWDEAEKILKKMRDAT